MKKIYQEASIELIRIGNDVIVTSTGATQQTDNGDGPGLGD